MQFFQKFLLLTIFSMFLLITSAGAAIPKNQSFFAWLDDYKSWAQNQGIKAEVLESAFAGIKAPRKGSLEADAKQPEFTLSFSDYYYRTVSQKRLQRAIRHYKEHKKLLEAVYQKYGVPPAYLLAFWGLESNFGDYTGKVPVVHTLATLAYDLRRRKFFEKQLLHALRIIQAGDIAAKDMQGSWAGAMGQTQFMPTTFTQYAIDGDGDGKRDLWNSLPDVFYSSANFLKSIGWKKGEEWGYQVSLPKDFDYSNTGYKTRKNLSYWKREGVRLAGGDVLPTSKGKAAVIVPAGHKGQAFLALENFRVTMRWNNSVLYALSIGLLAQQIQAGATSPIAISKSEPLATATVRRMQKKLNGLGFNTGTPDGVLGSRTKSALRKFQKSQNLPSDGYPTQETLQKLQLL